MTEMRFLLFVPTKLCLKFLLKRAIWPTNEPPGERYDVDVGGLKIILQGMPTLLCGIAKAVLGMNFPLSKHKLRISELLDVLRPGFLPPAILRRLSSSVQAGVWTMLRVAACLLFCANTSQAHDPYLSNTNIWLRPDNVEVDIFMNRTLNRRLLDNPPAVMLTDDNFDSLYHLLLVNCAPSMLEITVDGLKLEPRYVDVSLSEVTDLQFTFIYERPTGSKLRVTTSFVKKMDVGFMDSLVMNDGSNFLGSGEQTADKLDWEINLREGAAQRAPSTSTVPAQSGSHAVFFSFICATLAIVILLVILRLRRKSPS